MPSQRILKTEDSIAVEVYVLLSKEGKYTVAYCPSLDLSSYGKTPDDAVAAFKEAVTLFLEDTTERGTLEHVLVQLGWKLESRPEPKYYPPTIQEGLLRYIETRGTNVRTEQFSIPVPQ